MYQFKYVKDAYEESRKYKAKGEIASFPPYITFELTNLCNFKCIMCPCTYMKRKKEELGFNIFIKAIDEIAQFGSLIRFIGYDEPFLYSRIKDAIKYVKSKRLMLHITTNGSLLSEELIEFIVNTGVDSIIFSFQGLTQEEYCFMRNTGKDTYQNIIRNIQLLYNRVRDNKPYLTVTTTITNRDNPLDKDKFIKDHLHYANRVQITGFTHFVQLEEGFEKRNIWERLKIIRPAKVNSANCFIPNYEMIIRADGRIYPCCGVFHSDLSIGNIKNMALEDAWKSLKLQEIRGAVNNGYLDRFQDCKVCSIRYAYEDINSTVVNAHSEKVEKYLHA